MTAELNIGAAGTFQGKQKFGNPKGKKVGFNTFKRKAPWHGKFSDCKYCHTNNDENEMCESNPEYKSLHTNTF